MSFNEENKDTIEALREEIDKLKGEIQNLKSSLNENEYDDDYFEDREKKLFQKAKRRRRKHHRRYHKQFEFRELENLGEAISRTVCASIGDINDFIENIISTVSSAIESIDLDAVFDTNETYFRKKPIRWRYGEEPLQSQQEKQEKPQIYLDDREKMVLRALSSEKLSFQQLLELTKFTEEDLNNLINYLKENSLIVQEFSGSQRFIITKYGKKHVSEET